jgi:hypothetical protein
MPILLISAVIAIAVILSAIVLIRVRQPKQQEGELLRLAETSFTAVMAVMMIALAFFILYMKFNNSSLGGTGSTSYYFVAGFAVLCATAGSGILLFTFLKKIIAFEDRVASVSIFGEIDELRWNEITEVKVTPLSNKITLIGKNTRMAAGGEPKSYKEFLKIANKKIKHAVIGDMLEKQLDRFLF